MGGLGQELSSAGAVLGAWAVDAGSGTFFLSPFLLAGPVRVTGWLGSLSVLRIREHDEERVIDVAPFAA